MFYLYDNVYHLGVYNPKNLGNDKLADSEAYEVSTTPKF